MREANRFTWVPITEVAILFAGSFVTMVPALQLLEVYGREPGLTQPWQFFWLTGLCHGSSATPPSYLAFATMAAGSNDFNVLVANQAAGLDGPMGLRAISCGAVFMGAPTYICNDPNFLMKAIAERAAHPRSPATACSRVQSCCPYSVWSPYPSFGRPDDTPAARSAETSSRSRASRICPDPCSARHLIHYAG